MKYYSINEFSKRKILGYVTQTLRNWDKNNKLPILIILLAMDTDIILMNNLNQVMNIKPK